VKITRPARKSRFAEEQEAAEDQRVRVHDPLKVGRAHVQILLNRRQRHVHHGRVEDDHELRQADEDEDEPGIDVTGGQAEEPS
jgi:hypothetical protein